MVGYWSLQEQRVMPACRVSPRTTADVSSALIQLASLRCSFAIRSAGHMFWAGSANIEGGVTIDLSSLTNITVSADRTITSAGPGVRWGSIFGKLGPLNLTVVAGRVFDVGVAGLTIGGGNSWHAPRHGFVADNVANFEVVLASGETVNANASSSSDLYRALKGGGNNLGIVTRFDFKTFPQGDIWGGFLVLPNSYSATQLDFVQNFTTLSGDGVDDYAAIESIHAYNASGQAALASIITYTKPQAFPSIFSNLTSLQPQLANDLRITSLLNLSTEAGTGTCS